MRYSKLAFILITVLAVTGCKIRVVIPEGGSVETNSGAYLCASGGTCNIDVLDIFFDETFTARPMDGYEFKGWKKQARGLCGGNSGPCRLSTSFFGGFPVLMAFLESDEVFYLEPIFEIAGSDDVATDQNASACFSEKTISEGSVVILTSREANSGEETTIRTVVGGTVMFNGYRTNESITYSIDPPSNQTATNYIRVDYANSRSYLYGKITISPEQDLESTEIYEPPIMTRWDLEPGQTYSQTFETEAVTVTAGIESRETYQTELITEYLGMESIVVPAGTLDACRFTETTTLTVNSETIGPDTATYWVGVGLDLWIKSRVELPFVGEQTWELVSATINGDSIP